MVKLVGFYLELDPSRRDIMDGSIFDVMRAFPESDEAELVAYLDNGIAVLDIMESTKDVISETQYITAGSSVRTDGTWIWRVDLSHYIKNYHLALPAAFIDHARKNSYSIPELDQKNLLAVAREVAFDILQMRVSNPPSFDR